MFSKEEVISNEKIDINKIDIARKIITNLQKETLERVEMGCGPFLAAIYDENGKLIAKESNTVVEKCCSNNHAEVNTIRAVQEKLKTYDLSSLNLKMYITAEPCIMCIGAIMWSGIKEVYFGVPSKKVEQITGFDEGFKPNWLEEFKKRNIIVYGNIEPKIGEEVLKRYVESGKIVYKPTR